MNLFASFILKALAVLGKDIIFHNSYSRRPDTEKEWVSYMSEVCPPPGGSVLGQRRRREIKGARDFVVRQASPLRVGRGKENQQQKFHCRATE